MNEHAARPIAKLAEMATSIPSIAYDHVVAMSATGRITRADFLARVDDWQRCFSARDGDRYALYLEDADELAAALWGAWHAGKIVVLPGDRLPATLQDLTARGHGLIGDMPGAEPAPSIGHADAPLQREALDAERTVLVIFTSGSTGAPSAIEKTLRQLQAEVLALEAGFGTMLDACSVHGTVSHQHIYGLLFRVLWPLCSARAFSIKRLEFPEQIALRMADGPAVLISSPAHLKRLPDNTVIDWMPLRSRLRAVFSSGGPLSAESSDNVTQLWGQRPIEVFGSSETGGIAWRQAENGDSGWQPLPGVEWDLHDGHLRIRSPHLVHAGWWQTQDRAALRDHGRFELLGRSDRIIKLEERRISLTAIERALLASGAVRECAIVLLPGQRERLAAVAVLDEDGKRRLAQEGKTAMVGRLRAALADSVDPIAVPRHWRFLDALPCDSQGKTSQRALAELFRMSLPPTTMIRRSEDSAEMRLDIRKDLIVFDGHFSVQSAVVPGVALIDWAIRQGSGLFDIRTRFLHIEGLKFQQVIRPGCQLELALQWNAGKRSLGFRFQSVHGMHAQGRVVFACPEEVA